METEAIIDDLILSSIKRNANKLEAIFVPSSSTIKEDAGFSLEKADIFQKDLLIADFQ